MKTTLSKLFFAFFLLVSVVGKSQTPWNLETSGNYSMTAWPASSPAGTYPTSMIFRHWSSANPTIATAVESPTAVTCAYNTSGTTTTRMNGLDAGGFSFKNGSAAITGTVAQRLGYALLAINATNRKNIQVGWSGGKTGASTITHGLTCQYRVGATGAWTTLNSYVSSSSNTVFPAVTLPSNCDNQSLIQIRWAFNYVSGTVTNASFQLFVDDISVTSIPNVTIDPIVNTCTTAPAFTLTNGQPTGGVYSGPGVTGGLFDPAVAGNGTHTITYTYTDANSISNFATTTVEVDPMHCIVTSTLTSAYCGATGLTPNSVIVCEASPGATAYQFTVSNTSLGYSANWTVNAPYRSCTLNKFPGLQYGQTYTVTIKVMSGGILSAAGLPCSITLANLPTTSLATSSCNATGLTKNSYITCNAVSGATSYEWTFTNTSLGFSYVYTYPGPYRNLQLKNVPGLIAGNTYNVGVKATIGTILTQPGAVCPITLSSAFMAEYEGDGSKEFVEMPNLSAIVYPNPVSLESELKIQLNEIQTSTVIITDVMGRLVFEKQFAEMDLINISLAGMGISPGVYNVAVSNGTNIENNKIVVTK